MEMRKKVNGEIASIYEEFASDFVFLRVEISLSHQILDFLPFLLPSEKKDQRVNCF